MLTTIPSREALAGGHVKGAMVRAHLQFVRDRYGVPALERTLAALPPPISREIHDMLASSWCPFEHLVLLDRTIARTVGKEQLAVMKELGHHSAEINLSTVYRAFKREDIHEFFRRSAALHRQFQDFGNCEYEQVGPHQGRISVRNAACFSPVYCASETGYLEQVITMHGGKDPRVSESSCQCANDPLCTFELSWH